MNCYECNGTYRETTDLLQLDDAYVGTIGIEGIPYLICDNCNDILYTEQMSRAIDDARQKRIKELLGKLPLNDFISATDTASILGITRQALNKNRRISNGFIYYTMIGNFTVFLEQSVLRYKEIGDGRFPLYSAKQTQTARYIRNLHSEIFSSPYPFNKTIGPPLFRYLKDYGDLKEKYYAKR